MYDVGSLLSAGLVNRPLNGKSAGLVAAGRVVGSRVDGRIVARVVGGRVGVCGPVGVAGSGVRATADSGNSGFSSIFFGLPSSRVRSTSNASSTCRSPPVTASDVMVRRTV